MAGPLMVKHHTSPPLSVTGPQVDASLLARNTAFNLLGLGLPLLVALVAVPVLLAGLGPERFGLLSLAWMAIALVGEVGLGRAATRFVADALGRGQVGFARSVVRSTSAAQAVLGLFVGALVAALVPWLNRALALSPALLPEARSVFLLVAATLPLAMMASLQRGVLEATQRFDLVNAVRFSVSTGSALLPLLAFWVGWGIVAMALLLLALRAGAVLSYGILAAGQLGGLVEIEGVTNGTHRPELGVLLRYGGWVTVATLLTPFLLSIDRFMLGVLVSVGAVGIYTAPYELVLRLVLIPGSLAATLFPAFSSLHGMGRPEEAGRLLARSSRYVLAAVGSAVVLLLVGADPLLGWWLGDGFTPDAAIALRWLAPGVLAASLAQVPFSLLQGIGRADIPGKLYLLELPAVAAVAWLLVARWGIAGAAAAWSARAMMEAGVLYLAAHRSAPRRSTAPELNRSLGTVACLLLLGSLAWWGLRLSDSSAAAFAVLAVAAGVLATVLWRVTLEPQERKRITRMFMRAAA